MASYLLELLQQLWRDMLLVKTRTLLAIIGVLWGTYAVVLLLALGQGFYLYNQNNIGNLANGRVIVYFGTTSKPFQGHASGRHLTVKAKDITLLQKIIPGIKAISPILHENLGLSHGSQSLTFPVKGVTPSYALIDDIPQSQLGRFIDPLDIKARRHVVFLGNWAYDKLVKSKVSLIGHYININGVPFRVIGHPKPSQGQGHQYSDYDYAVYIPYTSAISLWGNVTISSFSYIPQKLADIPRINQNLTQYFANRFNFAADDHSALHIFSLLEFATVIEWILRGIQLFLGLCGGLTLAVAGLGVANIMFLIVKERTSEIGLRMALGAKDSHILSQILLEAGVMVASGGILGFIAAAITVWILQHSHLPVWMGIPQLSTSIVVLCILILLVVALFAGYFPARKAAAMQPVEALSF